MRSCVFGMECDTGFTGSPKVFGDTTTQCDRHLLARILRPPTRTLRGLSLQTHMAMSKGD